jgi:putative DNA primase/helicase
MSASNPTFAITPGAPTFDACPTDGSGFVQVNGKWTHKLNVVEVPVPAAPAKTKAAAAKPSAASAAAKADADELPELKPALRALCDFLLNEELLTTQRGLADIFNFRYGDNYAYAVINRRGEWMRWTGQIWTPTGEGVMQQHAIRLATDIREKIMPRADRATRDVLEDLANKFDNIDMVGKVVKWLRGMREVEFLSFDQKPNLFNFANGTYDLDTQKFREFRRDDYLTQKAAVSFRPGAKCTMFLKFLENSFPSSEVREYQQRWWGYCLTATDTNEEKAAPIFHGLGDNGKTILLALMMAIFGFEGTGAYGCACQWDTFAADGRGNLAIRNDLARLHNARVVFCDESSRGMVLNDGIFKQVVGGSPITARFLQKEFFTYIAKFKLVLATNNRPKIINGDSATWTRIHDIEMKEQFLKGDPRRIENLRALLMAEREGVVQWMIEGYEKFKQMGGLYPPDEIRNSTLEYQMHSDIQGEFFADLCDENRGYSIRLDELYARHKLWSKDVGERAISLQDFTEVLNSRKFKVERKLNEHGGPRYVYGLDLKANIDQVKKDAGF